MGSKVSRSGSSRPKNEAAAAGSDETDSLAHRSASMKNRIGVSACKTDIVDDSAEQKHLAKHKKTRNKDPATEQLIKAGMKQDRISSLLSEKEINAILQVMEFFEFKKNELIVEQGKTGQTFFVLQTGSCQVSVNGNIYNTISAGQAFGGLALLYNSPRTATVKALEDSGVWGANGKVVKQILQENAQKHYVENRKFLDSIKLFDSLSDEQKDRVADCFFNEGLEAGKRVMTEGDPPTSIYFVKKGELQVCVGGVVQANGEYANGNEISRLGPGDCFGERALLHNEPRTATVIALESCELLCISVGDLRDVLGTNLEQALESNLILLGLKRSPRYAQFTLAQQYEIVKHMTVRDYEAGAKIEAKTPLIIVIDGKLLAQKGDTQVVMVRGSRTEDGALCEEDSGEDAEEEPAPRVSMNREPTLALKALDDLQSSTVSSITVGDTGARVGILTPQGCLDVLAMFGIDSTNAMEAYDTTRKILLLKKVNIFRHLSQEQSIRLVQAFTSETFKEGNCVVKEGDEANSFYVIASGEVTVTIKGNLIRKMGKNQYFGERALLFQETRTASVHASSEQLNVWRVDQATFSEIVKGKMKDELMNRIHLQDKSVTLKDLKHTRVVGSGASGVVRLVTHKKTNVRYALKRVQKSEGKIPEEVRRECELMAQMDHPMIITLVKTFETRKSVYLLQELLTGGELHGAIRQIPKVLSRSQAQFYTGSLVIILDELSHRSIVYRDLKPENVMLDSQGYLKLIDFGIAKQLSTRTFTMIGTPHYMAPEVMRGHGYGTEVDLWSLGVMQYEFVCGSLPFADDLDDPTEVCRAVLKQELKFPSWYKDKAGKEFMEALLCRQPKKRLGAGINGFEDVRNAPYFVEGHNDSTLFDKIMGRELDPPVIPEGENFCDEDDEDVREADQAGSWSEDEITTNQS